MNNLHFPSAGGIVVEFGPISTKLLSYLIGALSGFRELALPTQLAKHWQAFRGTVSGGNGVLRATFDR